MSLQKANKKDINAKEKLTMKVFNVRSNNDEDSNLFLCVLNSSILGGICSDINKNSIRHV
jgi:hypothetical protein